MDPGSEMSQDEKEWTSSEETRGSTWEEDTGGALGSAEKDNSRHLRS